MAFDMKKFLNDESRKEIKNDFKTVKISVHKLRPASDKENFYHLDDAEIENTARSIELVGLQQNTVVKPIVGTDEYEVIAGHKRRCAVLKLISEGKTEYEMMPCKVEESGDNIRNELILLFTNSTQRDRTDYEKMLEIKRVRELLTEYQKDKKLPGRKQDIIASLLNTNKTKVGTLSNIEKNLNEDFMEEYAAGHISTSTANKVAGLDDEKQNVLYKSYKQTGELTANAVKEIEEIKEPDCIVEEELEGQMDIRDFHECLPKDTNNEVLQDNFPAEPNNPIPDDSTPQINEFIVKVTLKKLNKLCRFITEGETLELECLAAKCEERAGKENE